MIYDEINFLKNKHADEIRNYTEQIKEHIAEYGINPCDYLRYRQDMELYHRGAYTALIELEKRL